MRPEAHLSEPLLYFRRGIMAKSRNKAFSKKELGERVRALRIQKGLTQVELAKKLGMTQSNISELERGIRGLTIRHVLKLANILSASTDEILRGSFRDDAQLVVGVSTDSVIPYLEDAHPLGVIAVATQNGCVLTDLAELVSDVIEELRRNAGFGFGECVAIWVNGNDLPFLKSSEHAQGKGVGNWFWDVDVAGARREGGITRRAEASGQRRRGAESHSLREHR